MTKNTTEFFHEKYINKNEIDIKTLSPELQEKITSFNKLKEQFAGIGQKFKGKKREEMEIISQELLEEIENYIDDDEPAAPATEPTEEEKAKNKIKEKEGNGWGWFLGAVAFLGTIVAVVIGTKPYESKK